MHTTEAATDKPRSVRGAALVREMPLGRKLHPLLGWINGTQGLVAVPFGAGRLVHPASWTKAVATLLVAGEDLLPEFRLIAPVLRGLTRGTVVDVGANIGYFPLLMRRETARPVIGFEPQPFLHGLAVTSVRESGLRDVDLRRLACGDSPGSLVFQTGPNGNVVSGADATASEPPGSASAGIDQAARATLDERPRIRVPVVVLDEELAGVEVALMKVDCEGYELRILRGAARILERDRPHLLVEVHPTFLEDFGDSVRDVLDLLSPLYELEAWDFSPDRSRPKFLRSLSRYAPDRGVKFPSLEAMLAAAKAEPRPSQLYLLGRPRR